MNSIEITRKLQMLSDEKYKAFSQKLIRTNAPISGVRSPDLKAFAKDLASSDFLKNLESITDESYEHILLQGLIIGCAKTDLQTRLSLIDWFVPKIDNWAVCDSFCAALKSVKKYKAEFFEYIQKFLKSKNEFEIRFAVVILLDYFIDDEHIDIIFNICEKTRHEGYYVKMAVAWLLSVCVVKFPERTINYLLHDSLDTFTHNKAMQKARESFRINDEMKIYLKTLKR